MNNPISPEIFSDRLIDRLSYAHDASLYRVVPEAVARPRNESDIISLLKHCNNSQTPVTFRTAGTSLSGQAVGPGIIAETVRDWKQWKILDDGNAIRLQPGVIGGHANIYLSNFHRKIGPDPASINSCMIGGIIANNSSGMACGVQNNVYHTMRTLRFITADGYTYDTCEENSYEKFLLENNELAEGILRCKRMIAENDALQNKIRKKYRIKNTIGYSINSFLDHDHPLDIFAHLLIGSEGTLGFISEVVLNTVPDPLLKSTGLILFDDIVTACDIVPFLSDQGASALEVLDFASLATVKYLKYKPYDVSCLHQETAGLLCEFESDDNEQLQKTIMDSTVELQKIGGKLVNDFSSDAVTRENLWKVRKGLYPTVGALRKSGASVIAEDICVEQGDLPRAVNELHNVFKAWKFADAVVFGHAKDGNLHFASSIDMNDKDGVKRFDGMMKDLVSLTVNTFDGSLKAEHGTGRNMAPFVETEWGGELYEIMWEVKQLADPKNILNPGVLLNRSETTHIDNLKTLPLVNDIVDLCVECGFCESVCPSRNITMTPRQRIVISRELMSNEFSNEELEEIRADFQYSGEETCVTDGLCELECPVNIDTGSFIKDIRSNQHSLLGEFLSRRVASQFSLVQRSIRSGLRTGRIAEKIGPFPKMNVEMRTAAPKIQDFQKGSGEKYVYFPSCLNRTMAGANGRSNINMMMEVADKLNIELIIPKNISSMCCGMPLSSKGFDHAHEDIFTHTMSELRLLSENGQNQILMDIDPCNYHIEPLDSDLKFISIIDLFHDRLEHIQTNKMDREVLIHHTCSSQKLDLKSKLKEIVNHFTDNVVEPRVMECCGSGGDRGLQFPELSKSASGNCASHYPEFSKDAVGVSNSTMCEVSMGSATGVKFMSIIELVYDSLSEQ